MPPPERKIIEGNILLPSQIFLIKRENQVIKNVKADILVSKKFIRNDLMSQEN